MSEIQVVVTLGLEEGLLERIHVVDPRLRVTVLSRGQRRAYRGGRPVWAGYNEPPEPGEESEEEAQRKLDSILAEAEVVFTSPIIPPDIVARAPRLRWVQLTSAGVDRLLDSELLRSDVMVTTASGIHAVPISEYIIGLMLAFAKGLPKASLAKGERTWRPYIADEMEGRTAGIIGVGAIGARTALLAKALGTREHRQRNAGVDAADHLFQLSREREGGSHE